MQLFSGVFLKAPIKDKRSLLHLKLDPSSGAQFLKYPAIPYVLLIIVNQPGQFHHLAFLLPLPPSHLYLTLSCPRKVHKNTLQIKKKKNSAILNTIAINATFKKTASDL